MADTQISAQSIINEYQKRLSALTQENIILSAQLSELRTEQDQAQEVNKTPDIEE